ncbi:MAG TPA: hypothetical protein VHS05_13895 [Pyrinomonadaceae bacterium]|jgi:hypothetical protein|nr:hypothetical protein [Pyrinomonadaceae bacterium]
MNKCTESTEGWPDAPGDVSPDAEDAFLAHVARCPFHAEAFDAEIALTRSVFRLARGLNPHGRILRDRELRVAIADHDRRYKLWEEVAEEMMLPFHRIYLANRGEDIVCSGQFFDFRIYEGDHRLDTVAGLQIFGVVLEERTTMDVLLGYYPLRGVKHTGEEQFLPITNDYTIGLRVTQLSDRDFNIRFRCVENEVLELGRSGTLPQYSQPARMPMHAVAMSWTRASVQSLSRSLRVKMKLRRMFSVMLHGPSTPVGVVEWCLITLTIFSLGLIGLISYERLVAQAFANEIESPPPAAISEQTDKSSGGDTSNGAVVTANANQKSPANGAAQRANQKTGEEHVAPANNKPSVSDPNATPHTEEVNNIGPAAWYFQSLSQAGVSADQVVIHTGSDADLVKKLTAEMRKQDVRIRPLTRRSLVQRHVSVSWNIIRGQTGVIVEATLISNGDSLSLFGRGAGNCPEQACDEAVRNAVSKVFAAMKDLSQFEAASSGQ